MKAFQRRQSEQQHKAKQIFCGHAEILLENAGYEFSILIIFRA